MNDPRVLPCDVSIYEMDGIPRAYMELTGDGTHTIRFSFRTLGYVGINREEVELAMREQLDRLKAQLVERCVEVGTETAVIVWRRRPSIEWVPFETYNYEPHPAHWRITCRLDTSPHLAEDFLNAECRPEFGAYRAASPDLYAVSG